MGEDSIRKQLISSLTINRPITPHGSIALPLTRPEIDFLLELLHGGGVHYHLHVGREQVLSAVGEVIRIEPRDDAVHRENAEMGIDRNGGLTSS